jgi:hypothetical protein
MHYTCPLCKTENKINVDFQITEYICRSCSNLIDIDKNTSTKVIRKPVENVVLEIGQKGIIHDTEYTVTGIVIRKYGTSIFWREYYLKDKKGEDVFLSESDGHWVFLHSINAMDVKQKQNGKVAELHSINYRWYETTQCSIDAAAGFFEDKLDFHVAAYKEWVNGTHLISHEQSSGKSNYFYGEHISSNTVKNAFKTRFMPSKSGVGIVQPYFVNIKQAINIFCVAALFIALIQFYVYSTRTNQKVFEDRVKFEDVKNKELVSKSFSVSGGFAPLDVEVFSGVDNSWANIQLSLVNEKTNEIVYTSKDIEEYHGVESGESWSEGKSTEQFNLCGISPGTYHFLISAERQETLFADPTKSNVVSSDGVGITKESSGIINVVNKNTGESVSFGDLKTLEDDQTAVGSLVRRLFAGKNLDSLLSVNVLPIVVNEPITASNSVQIKAVWKPVSLWNFFLILIFMTVFFVACLIGRYIFTVSKWKNSSNSPYPQS